ncbi:hypothetical protein J3B00_003088 [Pseudomonas sp. BP8]|nr:hypothetical protein [Pseudomonas sp. BP8]
MLEIVTPHSANHIITLQDDTVLVLEMIHQHYSLQTRDHQRCRRDYLALGWIELALSA